MPSSPVTTAFITLPSTYFGADAAAGSCSFAQFTSFLFVKPTSRKLNLKNDAWHSKTNISAQTCEEFLFGDQTLNLSRWFPAIYGMFFSTFLLRLPGLHSSDVSKDELPWGEARYVIKGWERQMEETNSSKGIDLQGKQPFYKHHS